MPSVSLTALESALHEISDLRQANRKSASASAAALRVERALGRAVVVLLSSHFERYFYAVNEEAVAFVNGVGVAAVAIPEGLRLLHSKPCIDDLADTVWDARADKLRAFASAESWLWSTGLPGQLAHSRLLAWMTAPKPASLVRYYKYWGIGDVFTAVTRNPQTRGRLWLGIQELVDKRNNIAHGDFSAQATRSDLLRYRDSVRTFCERADRQLASALARLCAGATPW